MRLFIDAGNTRIKCLMVDEHRPRKELCFSSEGRETEIKSWLRDLPVTSRIVVSSVIGGDFEHWLTERCRSNGLVVPEFLKADSLDLGIMLAYENASSFGIDRYLAMAAACEMAQGAVIVVDCGTAITIDAVEGSGIHRGGVIMPGLEMMKHVLNQKTRGINTTESHKIDVFSRSTSDGVAAGALFSVVGGIREVLERQSDLMEERPELLVTGGSAEMIAGYLGLPIRVCHNLVFDGLMMFAKS